jgi:exopolyphosphatase / guanosine-5'-triphosphate,3'-diphosphate pyrophosphatase
MKLAPEQRGTDASRVSDYSQNPGDDAVQAGHTGNAASSADDGPQQPHAAFRPGSASSRTSHETNVRQSASPHDDGSAWHHETYSAGVDYLNFSAQTGGQIYGALDLGTNNCRLLLARPSRRGFRVVDAFSRIIRLGEGVSQSGRLSDLAMGRTMEALKVCAGKLQRHSVSRARLVATQACRVAGNGLAFIADVKREFDLDIEILTPELEAHLAVAGCATLIDPAADYVLVFDIGGGSSEIIWLDMAKLGARHDVLSGKADVDDAIVAWESLPVGVVTLAEHFGGRDVTPASFEAMVDAVTKLLAPFEARHAFRERTKGKSIHFLGTSGTVTTIAGVMLGLERYDRKRVDGIWLKREDIDGVTAQLLAHSYEERIMQPCIGRERADLVLAGCAILDAIIRLWPAERLRVADRGLREGILMRMMIEDGVWRSGRRRRGRGKRTRAGGA